MSQTMKPSTAAQKLGILLSAAPEDFQQNPITRDELDELRENPPAWLVDLRKNGPFPRDVIAAKLGVSNSGLARGGVTEPLNADQVGELLADPPAWLEHERRVHRQVLAENERLKAQKARDER
ncbi:MULTISPECIES: DUF5997 family protein [unclassified Luteococcus]|uniref:DUF5997 family protein n=1 Tax=unclassified Luteococcus TaxID=2639923 RepID=UPI00313E5AE6